MQITCQYCSAIYIPRPQTKNAKACKNLSCQKHRQRDNERDWRDKNKDCYDNIYHQNQRISRHKNLTVKIKIILKSLASGLLLKGFLLNDKQDNLALLLTSLGIRKLNKLYSSISP